MRQLCVLHWEEILRKNPPFVNPPSLLLFVSEIRVQIFCIIIKLYSWTYLLFAQGNTQYTQLYKTQTNNSTIINIQYVSTMLVDIFN